MSKVEEACGSNGRPRARRPPSRYGSLDLEKTASFKKKNKKRSSTKRRFPYKGSVSESSSSSRAMEGPQPSPSELGDGSERLPSNGSRQKARPKLAQRHAPLHKSVFDSNLLPDGTRLYYKTRKDQAGLQTHQCGYYNSKVHKRFEGEKKGSLIVCKYCKQELSPTQFEAHAGFGTRKQPYLNIYTIDGLSLHEKFGQSLKKTNSVEEYEDNCFICEGQDKEDLIYCRKCRKAFHTGCVLLNGKPVYAWDCTYCTVRPRHKTTQITNQCTKKSSDNGSCVLCRKNHYDDSDGFCSQTIILCSQCGKEYHVGCLKNKGMDDLQELPEGPWFCNEKCDMIYETLKERVANGEQELPETELNRIKKSSGYDVIRWRLLQGKMASGETRMQFSQAICIFQDAFGFKEAPTSIDLFPDMVYGRTVLNHDFHGMYCAVLLVNSWVVSAAILRVYGEDVAEIPFVATRSKCKGQGYFTALFSCIEDILASLNVKTLMVPVTKNAATFWKNKLRFKPITKDELKDYRRKYFTLMEFEEKGVLHRSVEQSLNCMKLSDSEEGQNST